MSEFKDIILKLRTEKGFTQGQLADVLGTSKSTVGMWEMGVRYPSKELYESIADYFNVDMDYLYGRSDIRKKVHYDSDGTEYRPYEDSIVHTLSVTGLSSSLLDSLAKSNIRPDALLIAFNKLNDSGKEEAIKRVQELAEITQYKKHTESVFRRAGTRRHWASDSADSSSVLQSDKKTASFLPGHSFEVKAISDGVAVLKAVRTSADPNTQSLAKAVDNKIKTTLISPDGKQVDISTNLELHKDFEGINVWAPSSTVKKAAKSVEKK